MNSACRRWRQGAASVPVAVALSCWVHPVFGAEWSAEPEIKAHTEINTNKRLTTADHDTVFGLIGDVGAVLKRATEINSLEFEPRVRINRFWGEDNLDYESYLFRFSGDHRLERAFFGLDAQYARDSALATELETTGFVQRQLAVDRVTVAPNFSYLLTERDRIDLSYNYNDVSYEEVAGSGLRDYTYKVADVTYSHDLTERELVFGQFSYGRFDVDDDPFTNSDTSFETDSYSLIGGFQGKTETLTGSVSGGVIYSEATSKDVLGQDQTFTGVGSLFGINVAKRFERSTATASYTRSVDPSGSGQQEDRNQWRAGLSRQFTERLTGKLAFLYLDSSTQFQEAFGGGDQTRTYLNGDAEVRYLLDPYWAVFLRYTYQEQSFSTSDDSANSNQVQVGLSYSGRKWPVSR